MLKQIAVAVLFTATISGIEQCCPSECTEWTFSTDLLILKAKEDRLGFTTEPGIIISPPNFTESSIVLPEFEWNYGIREKFAYNPWQGKWGLYIQWMHIVNRAKEVIQARRGQGMFPVWVLSDDLLSIDHVNKSEIKWCSITNVLDAVYNYHFFPVRYLSFTPWVGLRSEWIDQHVLVKYLGGMFPKVTDVVRMKNDFWGLGPVIGFNPEIFLGNYWSILVSTGVAMLGGNFKIKQKESYVATTRYFEIRKFGALRWNVDFLASLKLRIPFYDQKYAFSLQGGWESHWFFGQNQLTQNEFHLASSNRDLILQGWFASLLFAF